MVDLHGLDVKGAKEKVAQKEAWAKKVHQEEMMFIVGTFVTFGSNSVSRTHDMMYIGVGKHSEGPPVLKGSVREYLRKYVELVLKTVSES